MEEEKAAPEETRSRLLKDLQDLMSIPGLSGYEGRVRAYLKRALTDLGLDTKTDRLGNLITALDGDPGAPSVMLFTHMDQLGFVVRKIEPDGFLRIERVGGVPERALASQSVLICIGEGRDCPGVIANKSHHATLPDEKYEVVPYADLYIDAGFVNEEEARKAGIDVGTPIVYQPNFLQLSGERIAGAAIDDRVGCAALLEITRCLITNDVVPAIHIVFSVQEEFNLRGAVTAAEMLRPDIAIQLDLILASDTPDMGHRGHVALGAGPAMSLYSFHGRGTLNGAIPHPALVDLFDRVSQSNGIPLQRSAHTGALTETSYVQLVGEGVAVLDLGFPCRYTHSSLEVCDLSDLGGLADLLVSAMLAVDLDFTLDRDMFPG